MSTIGNNIRHYREEKGFTREELAIRIRVGTHKLEKYENGESIPDLQTILKISTALDCPASELFEKAEPNGPCGIDPELEDLIKSIGQKKAKLVLRRAKEISDDDFLHVMHLLQDVKYQSTVEK